MKTLMTVITSAILGTVGVYNLAKDHIPFRDGGHVKVSKKGQKAGAGVKAPAPSPLAEGRPVPPRSIRTNPPDMGRPDVTVNTETHDTRAQLEQNGKPKKEKATSQSPMAKVRQRTRSGSTWRNSAQTYSDVESPSTQSYRHPEICGAPPSAK